MNWLMCGMLVFGGLVVGLLIGWIWTELHYYDWFFRLKDRTEASVNEMKQAVAANVLETAEGVKKALTEAIAEHGDRPEIIVLRDGFIRELDAALEEANGDPVILTRIAKEDFPSMLMAIGTIRANAEETRRTGEMYAKLSAALMQVGSNFWRLTAAVIGPNAAPEEVAAVVQKLQQAHRALGEDGLVAGLPKLAEALAEVNQLAERLAPKPEPEPGPPSGGRN